MENNVSDTMGVYAITGRNNNHEREIYQEASLLKWYSDNRHFPAQDVFAYEEFDCIRIDGTHTIGACINSEPMFCRVSECDGSRLSQIECKCFSGQKDDPTEYVGNNPKCGWGVTAYISAHTKFDGEIELWCYYNDNSDECNVEDLYLHYFEHEREIYKDVYRKRYNHWEANKNTGELSKLNLAFYEKHLEDEAMCLIKTKEMANNVDAAFFGGKLKSLADGYVEWVKKRRQAEMYVHPQEAETASQILKEENPILTDEFLYYFSNNKKRAEEYIEKCRGLHLEKQSAKLMKAAFKNGDFMADKNKLGEKYGKLLYNTLEENELISCSYSTFMGYRD